jgi:cytosine deaminase
VLLYGIHKVIIGENHTFRGPEAYLKSRGVSLEVINNLECRQLMEGFIEKNADIWSEDVGE